MKEILKKAQDYFTFSIDYYEESRAEAQEIRDFNHNKHYTSMQLSVLRNRKQPAETFNIIKSYKRVLSGYLSSTINNINVKATTPDYTNKAVLGSDITKYTLRNNHFDMFRAEVQDELILSGMLGYETRVVDTGKKDKFGTPIVDIQFKFIPEKYLVKDPLSTAYDYSDGRFIHKFKWVPEETIKAIYPGKVKELSEYAERVRGTTIDQGTGTFQGLYYRYKNFLLVTSQLKYNDKIYELVWCNDILLEQRDITHLGRFSIKPFIMETDDENKYYGLFREVLESQKAINQALIQIQLLVNTNKVFVNTNIVKDLELFKKQYDRVNAVVGISDLNGYRVENLSGEVIQQYNIISSALDRIKQVLNLNDSFLGMAGSSASGRQVKLQQNMTASALQYLTSKLNFIYTTLAKDIIELSKLYFVANRVIIVNDSINGDKYVELNKPVTINGEVQFKDDIKYLEDGTAVLEPWIDRDTTITDLDYEIEVTTSNYNETDDMERVQLDGIIQGPAGQMLLHTDPASYAKVVEIQVKGMKTRNSEYIADIFEQVAQKLSGAQTQDPRQAMGNRQANGGTSNAGALSQAIGMNNDAAPAGYNQPKG